MKPFGIRLAFGAITILLGAIVAGQAQRNRQNENDSSWDVPTTQTGDPPSPIAGADDSRLNNPNKLLADVRTAEGSPFAQSDSAVRLVQHMMPSDDAQPANASSQINTPQVAAPSFEIPEMDLPTFQEPADSTSLDAANTDTQALPVMQMQLPSNDSNATIEANDSNAPQNMRLPGDVAANPYLPADEQVPTASAVLKSGPPSIEMNSGVSLRGGEITAGDGPFADADNQHGNVLRGGAGEELRSQPDTHPAMLQNPTTTPISEPINNSPNTMLRTLGLPEQGAQRGDGGGAQLQNPQANGFVDHSQLQTTQHTGPAFGGQHNAQLPNGPATISNSGPETRGPAANMRIVGGQQPVGPMPGSQNTSPMQMGPAQIDGLPQREPSLTNRTPGYGQPSNYGQQPIGYGQPSAPPLPPGQRGANIATLPNSNQGYRGGLGSTMAQPASARLNVDSSTTMSSPGDRRFDGVQSPSIVIQKRAPSEVRVGKPASFVIHVQNVGSVEAMDVRVHDQVPAGMRLIDASPTPVQQGDVLLWQLGAMRAGDERTVTMQLIPMEEGELGSVARVTFEAAASVRTISTRPELKIVQNAPEKVLIGQQLEIELEVSNPGTGDAEGVVLLEDVPNGLEHPKGRELDNALGTLRPGEVRRQVLRLRAVAPGMVQNTIRLKGVDGLEATHTVAVEVVSPQLQIALSGPSRRFLERQATFQLDIGNAGTADATNIEIAAYLDRGFTFVSTDFEGQYDPSRHAVFWSLASLPVGEQGKVPLTLLPVKEGDRAIRLEAKADLGITAKHERSVKVDSLAELTFQITDSADPVEIGGETTYEIRLTNSGSRTDSNVRVQLQFPAGIELLSSDADAETDGRGLIAFAPRRELVAGGEMTYRVKARGAAPGTHIVKAVVISDQSKVPVTKEESTMVYSDR